MTNQHTQKIAAHTAEVLQRIYTPGMAQFQRDFLDWVNEKKLVTIATPNPEHMVQSADDDAFWQALQRFDVLLPDGVGLVLANRWWRWRGREHNLPTKMHRISGREAVEWWLRHLEQLPENQKHKTLLLGAGTGIAEQLARTVDETSNWCLGLEGYTKISDLFASQPSEKTQQEHAFVMDLIQQEKPKVVFVAFGAPHQERWIQTYRQELEKSGVKVAMVCGGAFDYLVGEPKWHPLGLRASDLSGSGDSFCNHGAGGGSCGWWHFCEEFYGDK